VGFESGQAGIVVGAWPLTAAIPYHWELPQLRENWGPLVETTGTIVFLKKEAGATKRRGRRYFL
jgi:hypothetical protein